MKRDQLTPRMIRLRSNLDSKIGCWLWRPRDGREGYGQVRIDGVNTLAHRASWLAHFGDIPKGILVCHKCDTPRCVNPGHLFLGTHKDNTRDAQIKGRSYVQREGFTYEFTRLRRYRKLTDSNVRTIRESTESLAVLAERFGVSKAQISMVRRGKRKQLIT